MSVPASIDEAVRRLGVPLPARGASVVQRGYVEAHHRLGCCANFEPTYQGLDLQAQDRSVWKLVMSVLNV